MLAFAGRTGQVSFLLLVLMTLAVVLIASNRLVLYRAVRKESLDFKRRVGATLRNYNLEDLISLAQSNNSPASMVIVAGLRAFQLSIPVSSQGFALETAKRAATRTANSVRHDLSSGLRYLAAIVGTVLLVGAIGTYCHILFETFKGCGSSAEDCKAAVAYEIMRALVPVASSVLVAVPATWMHRYLESEVNRFQLEMETASLELLNYVVLEARSAGIL
jgi:biopolymer transport protein ExbB/TolQ